METLKRERQDLINENDNNNNDNKRRKIEETISTLEQLSNELFYEIFEYLDMFHIYQSFYNLNERFYKLIDYSNHSMKINIASMSQSMFNSFNRDIIMNFKHRINSINVTNMFVYDLPYFPLHQLLNFPLLENLVLKNIETKYLENLLPQLISLTNLMSLVIHCNGVIIDANPVYQQIFRLPKLKYCNLWFREGFSNTTISHSANEYSSIEQLVIENTIDTTEVDNLLSYVPRLRRLSICVSHNRWNRTNLNPPTELKYLTHLSLKLRYIQFEKLQEFVIALCPLVQVLYVSGTVDATLIAVDKKWEDLILFRLSMLRTFHFEFQFSIRNHYRWQRNRFQSTLDELINRSTSPFWTQQKCFYEKRSPQEEFQKGLNFYFSNIHKRKHYVLSTKVNEKYSSNYNNDINKDLIDHISIDSNEAIINHTDYFPNVRTLTFDSGFLCTRQSIRTILNDIIPLGSLTKLVIDCNRFSFVKMIDLLLCTRNLNTLIFQTMPVYNKNLNAIEHDETFRLLSKSNIIKNVTYKEIYSLEKIEILLSLCQRMECLSINRGGNNFRSIFDLLLKSPNWNDGRLFSLCFLCETGYLFNDIESAIESNEIRCDCMVKSLKDDLYIWR